ncbi:MAG TPA: N-acetylneuraminate synthase family protein [Methyloceanibacter sp.]|nr:N-acetylneuraminate synthase family protein [Methyloceanibacter sp.]
MAREMMVDGVQIADDTDTYVIAEIGNNHQGDLDKCKEMFKVAKQHCGVSAVKLQKRDNKSLFTRAMYNSEYHSENAFADTYGAHREKLEFGRDEYIELIAHAKEVGVTFFATAFDIPSADFLADLDMPAYKIASGDLTNTPLLKHVASFGKPIFVSTGGGTMEDVRRAYELIMPINRQLCLMQCTAGYPPEWQELDIGVITTFRHAFPDAVIGFSSHDSGIAMGPPAHVLGSRVIEKHFTLNRAMKGTDHAFSLEPTGLRKLVRDLKRTKLSLGTGEKRRYDSEVGPIKKMSKKLVAARDLPAGHVLTPEDIALKSPGDGLKPYMFDTMVGRRLIKALKADDALKVEDSIAASEEAITRASA